MAHPYNFSNSFTTYPGLSVLHADSVDVCRFGWGPNRGPAAQTPSPSRSPTPNQMRRPDPSAYAHVDRNLRPCSDRLYHQLTCGHRIRTVVPEPCAHNCLEPFDNGAATGRFFCSDCIDVFHTAQNDDLTAKYREQLQSPEYLSSPREQQLDLDMAFYRACHALYDAIDKSKREEYARTRPTVPCPPPEVRGDIMDMATELGSLSLAQTESRTSIASPQQLPTANRIDLPTDASQQLYLHLNGLSLDRGSCGVEHVAMESMSDSCSSPSVSTAATDMDL